MNVVIFILSLLFIWVVVFSIFFILGVKKGTKKVAKIFVSKVPNNGFHKVGVSITIPYDELIKLKEGAAEIFIVENVGDGGVDSHFKIGGDNG